MYQAIPWGSALIISVVLSLLGFKKKNKKIKQYSLIVFIIFMILLILDAINYFKCGAGCAGPR